MQTILLHAFLWQSVITGPFNRALPPVARRQGAKQLQQNCCLKIILFQSKQSKQEKHSKWVKQDITGKC